MATKSIETEATEVRAVAKYVRVSPSKARLVVDLIRRKPVAQAFDILHFCDRAVAVDVEKVPFRRCERREQQRSACRQPGCRRCLC